MLKLDHITTGYNGKPILDNLSLEVKSGQMVALIGPNGAGKTTLLRTINRTYPPWSGQVTLNGHDIWRLPPRQCAQQIALVEQVTKLAWPYTVEQILKLGRFPHQGWFAPLNGRDLSVIEAVLQQTDLIEFRHRPLNTLSGGERQRVIVARAMVQQPKILLLDEPSSNLDISHQHRLLSFVRDLVEQQGLTVVTAIHDLTLAARYCQRLLVLHQGQIYADGPPDAILIPDLLATVFDIEAQLYRDPFNQHWSLSVV